MRDVREVWHEDDDERDDEVLDVRVVCGDDCECEEECREGEQYVY